MKNPVGNVFDADSRRAGFAKNLGRAADISRLEIVQQALVLAVDRLGGRFMVNRGGNQGATNATSMPFTLKVRLLTGHYNTTKNDSLEEIDYDEYYALPFLSLNIMDVPEVGEIVNVLFTRPMTQGTQTQLLWVGRAVTGHATRDSVPNFRRQEPSESKWLTQSRDAMYSGERPTSIDADYDIKPEWNYFPAVDDRRYKGGDVFMMGKSNTLLVHSFGAHEKAQKRGYIEASTEARFIEDSTTGKLTFDWNSASDQEITDHQTRLELHNTKLIDAFRKKSRNEFLNVSTRLLLATRENVDARLWHKDTEKDWTGKFGNVQKVFDKNFADSGPGENCGQEIEKSEIHDKVDFDTTGGDTKEAKTKARNPITYDDFVSTFYGESEDIFRFVSHKGKDVSHAVLGETMVRQMIRTYEVVLHMLRTMDIVRDRLHKLSEDFLVHCHSVQTGLTLQPLASPKRNSVITEFPYHQDNTTGDVGGDKDLYDQEGSDSLGTTIKDRLIDERKQIEQLLNDLPDVLSDVFALN